jgi:micrococcal nuclease
MKSYSAQVTRVVDGDTVVATIDLGFDVSVTKSIRLYGIDTPESRTSDHEEKRFGLMAKDALTRQLNKSNGRITLRCPDDETDKFGRVLGELWQDDDLNINQWLVEQHLAVRYFGLNKDDIRDQHLKNRTFFDS